MFCCLALPDDFESPGRLQPNHALQAPVNLNGAEAAGS